MHYNGSVIRPPHEAQSVLLELTVGCSHNSCTFCSYYHNDKFSMAPMEQIEADLKEVRDFYPEITHIFAVGADPFVMSFERLNTIALKFREYLPYVNISMYASISNIKDKTVDQLKELQKNGITELVIGVESGDDEVLKKVNKGQTAAEIVEQCHKLDEAGITYRILYLGGLAGQGKCVESAIKSAAVINQINPTHIILTTLTLMPGSELFDDYQQGRFQEVSELERIQEILSLIENLDIPVIILGNHVSNSIPFNAELPRQKEETVKMLNDFIAQFDEEAYRKRRDRLGTI